MYIRYLGVGSVTVRLGSPVGCAREKLVIHLAAARGRWDSRLFAHHLMLPASLPAGMDWDRRRYVRTVDSRDGVY